MKFKEEYLYRYLHDTAILQVADDYRAKGYSITLEENIGEIRTDIIARKKEEVVVIEVKSGKSSAKRKKEIANLIDNINNLGNHRFLVVFVSPPKEKKLEIENFEELLSNKFKAEMPNELSKLSSEIKFVKFEYIDIESLTIQNKKIVANGNGLVNVSLHYSKEADDGFVLEDSYPFNFNISLKYNAKSELEIVDIINLDVDTTSFYE